MFLTVAKSQWPYVAVSRSKGIGGDQNEGIPLHSNPTCDFNTYSSSVFTVPRLYNNNAVNKYNTAVSLNQVEKSKNLNSNVVKHARMNNEYAHMFYSQKSSIENRFVSIDISSFMCLSNL